MRREEVIAKLKEAEPDPEILWPIVTDHLSVLDRTVVALLKES